MLVEQSNYPTWSAALVALSESGTVRWSRTLSPVNANYVVVTPGVERLWVVSQSLYLFTPSGDLLWDSLTGAPDAPDFFGGSATTSRLVAAQGKHLATYRAADHTLLWETPFAPLSDWLVPATITAQEEVLAKRTEDTLFAFNGADGRILRVFLDPDTLLDKRVFGVGTVPVGDRYYLPTANRLAAYDTVGPLLWLTEALARGVTEPAVGPDGTLYIQNRTHGLGALNPEGALRSKRFDIQPRWSWLGGPALAAGGIVYAGGTDGFWALDSAGQTLWMHVADSAGVSQAFTGSPAIGPDGTVYTWTGTHVYAFWGSAPPEPNSPWPMWRHDAQRTGWAR